MVQLKVTRMGQEDNLGFAIYATRHIKGGDPIYELIGAMPGDSKTPHSGLSTPTPCSLTLTPEILTGSFRTGVEYQRTTKGKDRLPLEEEEREYLAKRSWATDSDSDEEHESKVQGSWNKTPEGEKRRNKKKKSSFAWPIFFLLVSVKCQNA